MAVTVTDARTPIDQADATTNFNTGTANTTDYAEASGSISLAINESTGSIYATITAVNLTTAGNEMVYIWSANNATQVGWDAGTDAGPHSMYLGDGTNALAIHMAGNDRDVFKHADTQVMFQSFMIDIDELDTWNTDGHVTALSGTYSSFDKTAVTQFGGYYETLSKALGGGYNAFIDIMRYGNSGLTITGGTAGGQGTFLEIVTEDRSKLDGKGHGTIREYTAGIYGVQGGLTFGETTTGDSYFSDANIVLAFEDRPVANDKYFFNVVGSTTGGEYTSFILDNSTVTTAGPYVTCDFSDAGIDVLTLTNCIFSGLGNAVSFGNDAASAAHDVLNCVFNTCGQIDPGDVEFKYNSILNTTDANGGLLIDADGTTNISNLSFTSDGTGHAIYISATGTYDFTNFTYSGYGASETTDAHVYNNSGGLVTINVVGGDTPTVRNGASATTIVNSSVSLTITVKNESTTEIENAAVAIYKTTASIMKGAVADDGGSQTNETAAANNATTNDMTLLPSTPAVDDAYYFGATDKFWQLELDIGQNGSGVWTIDWEYWNGAWTSLSSSGLNDGTDGFRAGTGTKYVRFDPPSNWTTSTEQSITAYWVRAIVTAYTSITTQPLGTRSYTWAQLMNELTNASGVATESYNDPGGGVSITIRVRKSTTGTTRYYPLSTSGSISGNFSLEVVMIEDNIAST